MSLTPNSRAFNQSLLIFIAFILAFIVIDHCVNCGETCRRKDAFGNEELFSCPRLFESRKKSYCCGVTMSDKHCCEWSKKNEEYYRGSGISKKFFDGAIAIVVIILLIIGGLIVSCCVCACCLLSRKRQQRGQVISGRNDGTSVTTVNSYPTAGFPMQTVAPYPPHEPPPQYNYIQSQPPYNPQYPIK